MYCVYFTSYRGNKFPPFYIGSTHIDKIVEKQYRGSVASRDYAKMWKAEQKNNPHLFKVQIISIHESRQEAYDAEDKILRTRKCVASTFYLNQRCAKGLGYHPNGAEHHLYGVPLSNKRKAEISKQMAGRTLSDETKERQSKAAFARPQRSIETRNKMSLAKIGKKQKREHIELCRSKKIGCRWWNNGQEQVFNLLCPDGWNPGRLRMNGQSTRGKKWWNNGISRQLTEACPGPTWKPGKKIK